MKSASPMPMGARKVDLCFSAASMKTVKTSMVVSNISMKRPRTTEVARSVVRTFIAEGKSADTTPAEAMPARISVKKMSVPRSQPMAPMRHMPRVTWGGVRGWNGECVVGVAYGGVEEAARDAEEDPDVGGEREAEAQSDEEQVRRVWSI